MNWFREARFGMFIHWGTYSVLAGEYKGRKDYGEWIRESAHIPIEEYNKVKDRFNPVKFDAKKWAAIAKDAGMKYVCITTKHHEGFSLFDSKFSDYTVMNTPFKRDIMMELSSAVRAEGMKMCWYHSIMDWHHSDYLPRRSWELTYRPAGDANMDRYEQFLHNQVTELLTKYGPIGIMWFDGEWESTWNHARGQKLYDLCRKLQPNVIVNNRVDVGRGGMGGMSDAGFAGDYGTPEQEIPATGIPGVDWETCMTMNDHWGYCRADLNFKTTREIIRMLCDIASKGGNYLLNVGPTPEGEIPTQSVERLKEVGAWMKTNGDAIYGTTSSVFSKLPWGRCTVKRESGSTKLYLHVFDWPTTGQLVVPGLGNEKFSATLMKGRKSLEAHRDGANIVIRVPKTAPDSNASVIEIKVSGNPIIYDAPEFATESNIFVRSLAIKFKKPSSGLTIRYTIDGSVPKATSNADSGSLVIDKSCTVKAQAFHGSKPVSNVVEQTYVQVSPWSKLGKVPSLEPGIEVKCFDGKFETMPKFETLTPNRSAKLESISLSDDPNREFTSRLYSGYVSIPESEVYQFALRSDDGSKLWIDGQLVINNDGLHSPIEKFGVAPLEKGWHHIRVEWFNASGGADLLVRMGQLGRELHPIAKSALMRKA